MVRVAVLGYGGALGRALSLVALSDSSRPMLNQLMHTTCVALRQLPPKTSDRLGSSAHGVDEANVRTQDEYEEPARVETRVKGRMTDMMRCCEESIYAVVNFSGWFGSVDVGRN